MTRRKRYQQTASNYVSARPPQPVPVPRADSPPGASVFVSVALLMLVVLGLLSVGVVGIIGRWQEWPVKLTALATLATWGGAALVALPWLVHTLYPVWKDFFDDED